ncbi:hypothetical protein ACWD62_39370, partial [Streptomyces sp. NPDC005146]
GMIQSFTAGQRIRVPDDIAVIGYDDMPRRPASGATAQLSVPGELPQCITKYPKLCCRKSIRQERTRP